MNYTQAVTSIREIARPDPADRDAVISALIRYATLAPSGHNTQSWKFRVTDNVLHLKPDLTRKTPIVDPDDHHLYVSLGCAAENLELAAAALGVGRTVEFHNDSQAGYSMVLEQTPPTPSPLFDAITARQCTRSDFDGSRVAEADLERLRQAGSGNAVSIALMTEPEDIARVLSLALRANAIQVTDRDFRHELESWVRFSDREAISRADGLSARVTGNPPSPRWLGKWLFRAGLRESSENAKLARQVESAAGLAVFVSAQDDKRHWAEAGRCYQRFALQATALGLKNAFLNQPVEVPAVRADLVSALQLGTGRPDLVVRFGRAPAMPYSPRRALTEVMQGKIVE